MRAIERTDRQRLGPECLPAAFTLVEVLIASVILLVAIPPMIQTAITISRMDRVREERSLATNLGQVALEHLHHRLYQMDKRAYRLSHTFAERRTAYGATPPGWLRPLRGLAEPARWVVDLPSRAADPLSEVFSRTFASDNPPKTYPWSLSDTRPTTLYRGLTSVSNPDLARDALSYRVTVAVSDYPVASDAELRTKGREEPKVDLVDLGITIGWQDVRSQPQSQVVTARLIRNVHEPDPTTDADGGI